MGQQRFVRKNMAIYDAQRRQEKKRSRRNAFYICLFTFVSLVFIAICVAVFLNVKAVDINGNERYSDKEISKLVPIEIGDNMLSFDADSIEEAILQKYPYIKEVNVKRDFPTTVVVEIVESKAYYTAAIAGDTYLLSPELKVLEKKDGKDADGGDCIKLSLNNVRRCIVGEELQFVDDRTYDAVVDLQEIFKTHYIDGKITSIDIRSRFDIYINYDNRFKVYLGDMENAEVKIRFLVRILEKQEDGATGTIDISNPQEAAVAYS
jgi:cell division septal protein FtsQ